MKSILLKPHEVRCLQDKGEVLVVRALPKQPVLFGGRVDGRSTFRFFKNKREWIDYRAGSFNIVGKSEVIKFCPFGVVGERRWVKESWAVKGCGKLVKLVPMADSKNLQYPATDKAPKVGGGDSCWWNARPSNQMPQWASRFTIENTRIECRQVQSISNKDAAQCGFKKKDFESPLETILNFHDYWQSQHKKPPLDLGSNPYSWFVWVRRVECI